MDNALQHGSCSTSQSQANCRMDPRVSAFRDRYRSELVRPGYSGWRHALLTFGIGTAVILASVLSLHDVGPLEWLAVPLTLLYANLSEYFGHRGPMHHRWRWLGIVFDRHAGQHHRFFTDREMSIDSSRDLKAVLFPTVMIAFFLLAFAAPAGLLLGWLFGANVAWLFVATAVAYFLNYELLHLLYHLPQRGWMARLPGIGRLRRLHLAHHDPRLMSAWNFNITYPVGDLLFGTLWRGPAPWQEAGLDEATWPQERRSQT
jgi:hypothetical protein